MLEIVCTSFSERILSETDTVELPPSSEAMAGSRQSQGLSRSFIRDLAARVAQLEAKTRLLAGTHTDQILTHRNENRVPISMLAGHTTEANEDEGMQREDDEHADNEDQSDEQVSDQNEDEVEDGENDEEEEGEEGEDGENDEEEEGEEGDGEEEEEDEYEEGECEDEGEEDSEEEPEPQPTFQKYAEKLQRDAIESRQLPAAWFISNTEINPPNGLHETEERFAFNVPLLDTFQADMGLSSSEQEATPQMGCYQQEYNAHVMPSRLEYRANGFQQKYLVGSLTSTAMAEPADHVLDSLTPGTVVDSSGTPRDTTPQQSAPSQMSLSTLGSISGSIHPNSALSVVVGQSGSAGLGIGSSSNRVIQSAANITNGMPTRNHPSIQLGLGLGVFQGGGDNEAARSARFRAYRRSLRYLRVSALLPISRETDSSAIYTVSLIPLKFQYDRVIILMGIFRRHAPYLPTLVTMERGEPPQEHFGHSAIRWLAGPPESNSTRQKDAPLSQQGHGWPMGKLAVEIYERIASELEREDVMNMRLVNREFEKNVSGIFYQVAVVPFRAQIYMMMMPRKEDGGNGTAKAAATPNEDKDHGSQYGNYLNVTEKDLYNGMKVFRAWGTHIRKFAMTFEADEVILRKPPTKGRFETFTSFWGQYVWPRAQYIRYQSCEYLEKKADETCLMESALSNLSNVSELALSVDSGLGWIVGPDQSDREELYLGKPKVFGSQFPPSSSESQARFQKWTELTARVEVNTVYPSNPILFDGSTPIISHDFPPLMFGGVNYEALPRIETIRRNRDRDQDSDEVINPFKANSLLIPNELTTAQTEWLLETQWAQDAFLTSWYLALVNNAATFSGVRSLTITRFSSGHLMKLQRQDIWTSLKNLKNLTITVLPDWNEIGKTDTGLPVETCRIEPSLAAHKFLDFLEQCIADVENLTTLKIGYDGGGEQAQGIYARNKHVLRAPIVEFDQRTQRASVEWIKKIIKLPHVQHLTLCNCWITPDALKTFVHQMQNAKLSNLVLDSVSLTAQPGENQPLFSENLLVPPIVQRIIDAVVQKSPDFFIDAHTSIHQRYTQRLLVRDNDVTFVDFPVAPPEWLTIEPRKGSWPDIINTITPGQTLDEMRFLSGLEEEAPVPKPSGSLSRVEFISCGYIHLSEMVSFDQRSLMTPEFNTVKCLDRRVEDLSDVMMAPNDVFLGQIVTFIEFKELIVLMKVWGMTHGWSDDGAKWETREDGQPAGGSGRFSGSLESF